LPAIGDFGANVGSGDLGVVKGIASNLLALTEQHIIHNEGRICEIAFGLFDLANPGRCTANANCDWEL
jgi:hypothetical protein